MSKKKPARNQVLRTQSGIRKDYEYDSLQKLQSRNKRRPTWHLLINPTTSPLNFCDTFVVHLVRHQIKSSRRLKYMPDRAQQH